MVASADLVFEPSAWIYNQKMFRHLSPPEAGTIFVMSRCTGELGTYCPATRDLTMMPPASFAGGAGRRGKSKMEGRPPRRVSFAEDVVGREGKQPVQLSVDVHPVHEAEDLGRMVSVDVSIDVSEESFGREGDWRPDLHHVIFEDFDEGLLCVPGLQDEDDHDRDSNDDSDNLDRCNSCDSVFSYADLDEFADKHTSLSDSIPAIQRSRTISGSGGVNLRFPDFASVRTSLF